MILLQDSRYSAYLNATRFHYHEVKREKFFKSYDMRKVKYNCIEFARRQISLKVHVTKLSASFLYFHVVFCQLASLGLLSRQKTAT